MTSPNFKFIEFIKFNDNYGKTQLSKTTTRELMHIARIDKACTITNFVRLGNTELSRRTRLPFIMLRMVVHIRRWWKRFSFRIQRLKSERLCINSGAPRKITQFLRVFLVSRNWRACSTITLRIHSLNMRDNHKTKCVTLNNHSIFAHSTIHIHYVVH